MREAPHKAGERRFENDPARVPPEYSDLVGLDAYTRAMTELRDLSQDHQFEVLVFSLHGFPKDIRAVCEALGFSLLSAKRKIKQYLQKHGIEKYEDSMMTVSEEDPHPSPITHQLVSQLLLEHLVTHYNLPVTSSRHR